MKKYMLCLCLGLAVSLFSAFSAAAKDYPVSLFGIRSDGVTLNTRSIQFAIDYINGNGGGRLVFDVGRYLTGSIHLKSGVTIVLREGAVIVGSLNPFDYDKNLVTALIFANDQHDIAIEGKGVIDGQGRQLAFNVADCYHKGLIKDLFRNGRPEVEIRAMLIEFRGCRNVVMKGITLRNSASWVETYDQCTNLRLDSIYVDSRAFWNNDGIDIVDCDSVAVINSYIDADDDGICLKSQDASKLCNNILIHNNVVRSSANAIKFGTTSFGGFRNIRITDNKVFDTYRSAIALEAVDGGFVEDVDVDGLTGINIGNAIFLRIGERQKGRKGKMDDIRIRHVDIGIVAGKPDAGYDYEGPIEDMPRNISPMVIAGLPDALISKVSLEDVDIRYPGGGNPLFARLEPDSLDKVPERPEAYPDFSMFRELPAWGVYIRHAEGIEFTNVRLSAKKKDYRTAIVLDDVRKSGFAGVKVSEPAKKAVIYQHKTAGVTVK